MLIDCVLFYIFVFYIKFIMLWLIDILNVYIKSMNLLVLGIWSILDWSLNLNYFMNEFSI